MLNATLFTVGSPYSSSSRDRQFLACQGNSFRGRGKSTSRIRSFVRNPLEDNLGVSGGGGVSRWTSPGGQEGLIACPVSRCGIARDISYPLALPLAEELAQLPQMTIATTGRSLQRFNTNSTTPPAVPIIPLRAVRLHPLSLASVSSSHVMPRLGRWNDKRIYYSPTGEETLYSCRTPRPLAS